MTNKSYNPALDLLARGFPVFSTANAADANSAKDNASRHLRVVETMRAENPEAPWFVRARTRDGLLCIFAQHESDLRRLEQFCGASLPKTWAIRRIRDGKLYLLFGIYTSGPVFHSYQELFNTKAEILLYAPLPDGEEYEWVHGFSPDELPIGRLPPKIMDRLPKKHETTTPGESITARIVTRAEFDAYAHKRRHERIY